MGSGVDGKFLDTKSDKTCFRMYDYVTKELPALVSGLFPVDPVRMSISGHSMGGHGAMVAHLKNPGKYASVSGNHHQLLSLNIAGPIQSRPGNSTSI